MNEKKLDYEIATKFGSYSKFAKIEKKDRTNFKRFVISNINSLNARLELADLEIIIVRKSNENIKSYLKAAFPEAHISDYLIEKIKENL